MIKLRLDITTPTGVDLVTVDEHAVGWVLETPAQVAPSGPPVFITPTVYTVCLLRDPGVNHLGNYPVSLPPPRDDERVIWGDDFETYDAAVSAIVSHYADFADLNGDYSVVLSPLKRTAQGTSVKIREGWRSGPDGRTHLCPDPIKRTVTDLISNVAVFGETIDRLSIDDLPKDEQERIVTDIVSSVAGVLLPVISEFEHNPNLDHWGLGQ